MAERDYSLFRVAVIVLALPINVAGFEPDDRQCGPRALTAVARLLGSEVRLEQVISRLPNAGKDVSLDELRRTAEEDLGLACIGVHWDIRPPADAPPAIVGIAGSDRLLHFVAVLRWGTSDAVVQDGDQLVTMSIKDLRRNGWSGDCLHVGDTPGAVSGLIPAWWTTKRGRWQLASFFLLASAVVLMFSCVQRDRNRGLGKNIVCEEAS